MYQSNHISAWLQISLHLVNLFMWAVLFNSKLMTTRPPAAQLTTFYLCLASGGAAADDGPGDRGGPAKCPAAHPLAWPE
jgi:hypothetical protein